MPPFFLNAFFISPNALLICGPPEMSPGWLGEKTFVSLVLRLPPWVPDFQVAVVVVFCPPTEMLVVVFTLMVMPPVTTPPTFTLIVGVIGGPSDQALAAGP